MIESNIAECEIVIKAVMNTQSSSSVSPSTATSLPPKGMQTGNRSPDELVLINKKVNRQRNKMKYYR